jgi:type I restriction enzyme S subunit
MDRPWIEAGLKVARLRESDLPALLVQRVARLRALEGLNQGFLAYLLYERGFTDYLKNIQTGTAVPHISAGQILDYSFQVPPLDEQVRIAEVLASMDDLIAVDQSLIGDLERLADTIALASTATGEVRTFGEVATISGGGTPSTKRSEYWGGPIVWATPTDMTALPSPYLFDSARRISQEGLESCSSDLYPPGSILMTSRATIGITAVSQVPTAVNQGFIVVQPSVPSDRWYLFHQLRQRVPEFIQRANGSTFLEISRGVFKSLAITWPTQDERAAIHDVLDPIHVAAASLQIEVDELRRARDELLPMLLSGRVSANAIAS